MIAMRHIHPLALQNELRNYLRKLSYSISVKEALPRIETMVGIRNKQPLAMQIISEFIFLEKPIDIDMRKPPPPITQLTLIREFQLLAALVEYFSQPGSENAKRTVFFALFGCKLTMQRKRVLCRLISTAISESILQILEPAGTWFEQIGQTTNDCLEIAQGLVHDFITFARKTSEQLKNMPIISSHFASNFLTVVASLYLNDNLHKNVLVPPPDTLLLIFSEWLTNDVTICFPVRQAMTPVPVIKSLPGLIRWSVLAPLVSNDATYSKLHLALLSSIDQLPNCDLPPTIPVPELMHVVISLQKYASSPWYTSGSNKAYQKSMERFAQILLIALRSKCILGNVAQLITSLKSLPNHRLMDILLKTEYSKFLYS